jgi:2-haloacid dehalogenase
VILGAQARPAGQNRPSMPALPAALVFDVFGTVVDWHGSVAREVRRAGLPVDAEDFARAWRAGYAPAMDEVRGGRLPWTSIDGLHRRILDRLLADQGLAPDEAARADLNLAWHRLDPWPDVCTGLARLRTLGPVATLSDGNVRLPVFGAGEFDRVADGFDALAAGWGA